MAFRRRESVMRRLTYVLPMMALALAGVTGCGSNGPSYFVASSGLHGGAHGRRDP